MTPGILQTRKRRCKLYAM